MSEVPTKPILCFGEALWDSLPRGLFPGGAPMNVAYHLKQLGSSPMPVTALGNDPLGDELLHCLRSWGVDVRGVFVHPSKPTGIARVAIVDGSPRFEIAENVAWDGIELQPAVLECAGNCAAVVFGSLAQRSESNRATLSNLLNHTTSALRVFDVNLRPPYDSDDRVWWLARQADIIKLNDHEMNRLLNRTFLPTEMADAARQFAKRAGVARLCVTAGAAGAGLLLNDEWRWESAQPVAIRDTVGAGDAFLAALLVGLLRGTCPTAEILRRACRLAEFVATQDGATPAYRVEHEGYVTA